jgi:hypothetical protein
MKAIQQNSKTAALCAVMTAVVWIGLASGGNLNPPSPPTAGTMEPLDDVEPRTAIHQSDIPLTISTPGSYYLAENLRHTANSACITVTASHVTIDLCGFTMDGGGTGNYGFYLTEVVNVEIRNGTIYDFEMGIIVPASSTAGSHHRVLNVRLLSCSDAELFFRYRDNCQVRDCTVADGSETGYCIIIGDNGIVSGNTIYNNSVSSADRPYGVYAGSGSSVIGNTSRSNGNGASGTVYGIYLAGYNLVNNNTAYGNKDYNMNTSATSSYGTNVPQLP